ncbi:hypothetical protein DICVIV_12044 [Dictyocaulus viviparus]|uniref:Uncharacterized protein n=1 Tax=Dictyocaulus viviparus TaxID=29172 RepID=A0A0D8XE84_DICVI|nr:hypothetical protein DICVIV_12044 [Dictyocaulus viviparus]
MPTTCARTESVVESDWDAVLLPYQVSRSEAEDLARSLNIPYVECSAKLRMNVDQAFHAVVRLVRRFKTLAVTEMVVYLQSFLVFARMKICSVLIGGKNFNMMSEQHLIIVELNRLRKIRKGKAAEYNNYLESIVVAVLDTKNVIDFVSYCLLTTMGIAGFAIVEHIA